MDGILTEKDAEDRFFVMKPCTGCFKYSKHDTRKEVGDCSYCHSRLSVNGRHWYSLRTYNSSKRFSAVEKKKL